MSEAWDRIVSSSETSVRLKPEDYFTFFRDEVSREREERIKKQASYALERHVGTISFDDMESCGLVSFVVPGLAENKPKLELGDIVLLEHLRVNENGDLIISFRAQERVWLDWTGKVYNSRVVAINRATSCVTVRDDSLTAAAAEVDKPGTYNLALNIHFPLEYDVRQGDKALESAIARVQLELHDAGVTDDGTTSDDNEFSNLKEGQELSWIETMLFPAARNLRPRTSTTSINPTQRGFFDSQLDELQQTAVRNVVSIGLGNVPRVIVGPPGTGKTRVVVEAVMQLCTQETTGSGASLVLVCSPSDQGADALTSQLAPYFSPPGHTRLLRLNRPTRRMGEVSVKLLPWCHIVFGPEPHFAVPGAGWMQDVSVVVTTCRDSSMLYYGDADGADFQRGARAHNIVRLGWTGLIIDNAHQVTEPECMIPLGLLLTTTKDRSKHAFMNTHTPGPLVILAGDPKQIRPTTLSPSSALRTSYLERIVNRAKKAGLYPVTTPTATDLAPWTPITRLLNNYRSHPAILVVPDAAIYRVDIAAKAGNVNRLRDWSEWRGRRWPVIYHENGGRDETGLGKKGCENASEAVIAVQYAVSLVGSGLVKEDQICIMAAFGKQVDRIRQTIRDEAPGRLDKINLGIVEDFQGREFDAVILCTTRSKPGSTNSDRRNGLGIVLTPEKLAVALTRAKYGLIVIGKRQVLGQDNCWRAFLRFCTRNGLIACPDESDRKPDLYDGEAQNLGKLERELREQMVQGSIISRQLRAGPVLHQPDIWRKDSVGTGWGGISGRRI